jgi:hypothetical protein
VVVVVEVEKGTIVLVLPKREGRELPPTVGELKLDWNPDPKGLVGADVATGCEKLKEEDPDDVENAAPREAEDWIVLEGTDVA